MNLLLSDAYDQPRDPEREQPLRIFSHRKLRISVQCVVSVTLGSGPWNANRILRDGLSCPVALRILVTYPAYHEKYRRSRCIN